ncbi:L-glyceraldehyde 3-phosphate reductase [compost metagenome]
MQNLVNLIYREEEREMLPLCKDEKIAVMPWSPLAKGRLTREWNTTTERSSIDEAGKNFFPESLEADKKVVERVSEIAVKRGVPKAQVALSWVLQKEAVVSPIIGSTKVSHIEYGVAALSIKLTQEEIEYLEEPYVPHSVVGFK